MRVRRLGTWDVFHADRLELERGLDAEAICSALARGELRDDDLVRPAGSTTPWARIADIPELMAPPSPPGNPVPMASPVAGGAEPSADSRDRLEIEDFEEVQPRIEEIVPPPRPHEPTLLPGSSSSDVTFPVIEERPENIKPGDRGSAPERTPSPVWCWDDDDEDDEDDDDDERKHVVIQDRGDIEILAEDNALANPDQGNGGRSGPRAPLASRGPISEVEAAGARSGAGPAHRWDRSDEDLDLDTRLDSQASHVALPVVRSRDRDEGLINPETGEDADAEFSLSRKATEKIEELDLAPMVDVAFNLVLFFMVTATTVLYKTLEIPKPSGEAPPGAVAQGRSRSLEDLKDDYILVEIDDRGSMKFDREPIEPVMETLVERMRIAREKTGRKSMLLSADYATAHRNAVLAYDAANEIGLGIAIAKPQPPQGPAPALRLPPAATAKPAAAPAPTPTPPPF